jgi:hypothetical protein
MIDRGNNSPTGWCPQQDYVPDGKRYYRALSATAAYGHGWCLGLMARLAGACRPTNPKAIR